MWRRFARLLLGMTLCGFGQALTIRASFGLAPWDVLHQAVANLAGVQIGQAQTALSAVVLLLWLPLRQKPGIGTLINVVWVGQAVDLSLAALGTPFHLAARATWLLVGTLTLGVGIGVYISAHLGPGPRDGLMTGIAARGYPIAATKVVLDVAVVAVGWMLGGPVGVGTVFTSVAVGPIAHRTLDQLGYRAGAHDNTHAAMDPTAELPHPA